MIVATKRHRRRSTGWAEGSRPVTCAEFAAAMFRAGQTRREVIERLNGMVRWRPGHVRGTAYKQGQRLGLVFGYGGGQRVEKPVSDGQRVERPVSDGTKMLVYVALRGQPDAVRRQYRKIKGHGVGSLEALRALGLHAGA